MSRSTVNYKQKKNHSHYQVHIHCYNVLFILYSFFLFFVHSKRTLKTVAELKEIMLSLYDTWRNKFGVLLFLYSVILTKVGLNCQFMSCSICHQFVSVLIMY